MSRFNSGGSYSHRINYLGDGCYRLSWVVDRHYANSRLRWPRRTTRDTDKAGAVRFAKRWGIDMPIDKKEGMI